MAALRRSTLCLLLSLLLCSIHCNALVLRAENAIPNIQCPRRFGGTKQLAAVGEAVKQGQTTMYWGQTAMKANDRGPLDEAFWKTSQFRRRVIEVLYRLTILPKLDPPYQLICINSEDEASRYHSSLARNCQISQKGIMHFGNEPTQRVPANTVFICPLFWTLAPPEQNPATPDPQLCPRVVTQMNEYQSPDRYNPSLFENQVTSMMIAALYVYGGKMFKLVNNKVDLNDLLRLEPSRAVETMESYYAFAILAKNQCMDVPDIHRWPFNSAALDSGNGTQSSTESSMNTSPEVVVD